MRQMLTMYLPDGYKDVREFFKDCEGFERVEWASNYTFDMRRPDRKGFDDSMQVMVRRSSLWERLHAACWILFVNWRRP